MSVEAARAEGADEALAVLRFGGAQARAFLQGQLSNDLRLLGPDNTLLAALNSPQGRVTAVLRLFQRADVVAGGGPVIHAVLPRSIAGTVVERLRKYVLRSKVTLAVVDELAVVPHLGGPIQLAPDAAAADAAAAATAATHALDGDVSILAFQQPDPRALLVGSAANVSAMMERRRWQAASWNDWRLAQIGAGEPQVYAATSERFVAQMLNLDLVGAVSFAKGCYTGQEIIVRTQHLGRIKRRMVRLRARGQVLAAGDKVSHDGQTVADVVEAASVHEGCEVLAVVAMTNLSGGAPGAGIELERLPLTYAVGDEATGDAPLMA